MDAMKTPISKAIFGFPIKTNICFNNFVLNGFVGNDAIQFNAIKMNGKTIGKNDIAGEGSFLKLFFNSSNVIPAEGFIFILLPYLVAKNYPAKRA